MRKPNLFILGAPKCGTTAVAKWLSEHPDVFVSSAKEPHYFCEEYRLTSSIDEYEALFSDAPQTARWLCEASVWYLFSDTALPNILRYSPDARFVVMLRRPVELIPSMHEQQRFNGNELVENLSEALRLNEVRESSVPAGVRKDYKGIQHLAYYRSCALGWQVKRLLSQVDRNRVHFVLLEELSRDSEETYRSLLNFLDIAVELPSSFRKVNPAKERISFLVDALVLKLAKLKEFLGMKRRFRLLSSLRRRNVRYRDRQPLEPQLRSEIVERLSSDTLILEKSLGHDLSEWRKC